MLGFLDPSFLAWGLVYVTQIRQGCRCGGRCGRQRDAGRGLRRLDGFSQDENQRLLDLTRLRRWAALGRTAPSLPFAATRVLA